MIVIFSLTFFFAVSGCKSSPWEDCPENCQSDRFSIETNLALLKEKEKSIQINEGRTDFKVALIADSQRHPEDLDTVIELISNRREEIDFILFLGDLTDAGLEMEFDWVCKILKKTDLPFFAVIGNHDLLNYGEEIWRGVFGPLDYSLSFLGTKFILFNSNKMESSGAPNLAFIKAQAKIEPGETRFHTIAGAHVPPSDGSIFNSAESKAIKDTFMESGIHVSIHGHLHKSSYTYDETRDLYQYIISRLENNKYGILTITRNEFSFENCSNNSCTVALPE
ncbi:metallophosphoesterase [bacterium]|nr:metallophosphoesterase [bacterium]